MTAKLASQVSFDSGVIVGGKYRIISLIGIGGVGRVYLARHIELDTEVAIKVLKPEMSDRPDAVSRFSREARASVRLRSERIARVLDVGTHEGKPYFVMEYLVGCNLLEARQQANVDIATLCEFFIQACEGLADAHAQGVVHRDIKPENLFVVRDASGWRSLKVFDFGISKFSLTGKFSDVDLAAMRTEAMMGTPHYISPEQIRSTRDVDHRTDLWSLGAVMFEVLSDGVLPFREERELTALVAEVLERPHRSLLDIAPNVPERLVAIVDRCLEKDRDFRYQTAAEVALDLLPLAPARARASVERAVSVMQAAGMMPLNGDMESLRPMPTPHSDRLSSPPPRSSSLPPPPSVPTDTQAPNSETRPSGSAISLGTPPPMPARRSVPPSSSASVPSERTSAPPPSAVTTEQPATSVQPAASAQPVVLSRRATLAEPLPSSFEDQGKPRKRKVALVMLLILGCMVATVFLLSTRAEGPEVASKPLPPVLAVPASPTEVSTPDPRAEPTMHGGSSASALPVPSSEHKAASTKAAWVPRPAAPPPAPKVSALKIEDPSPPPPPPPPPNKLELRRER